MFEQAIALLDSGDSLGAERLFGQAICAEPGLEAVLSRRAFAEAFQAAKSKSACTEPIRIGEGSGRMSTRDADHSTLDNADAAKEGAGATAVFVRRPVLTIVLNLLIVIAGIAAFSGVEVRELPNIDRPVITVRTNYTGASPETTC